MAQDDIQGTVLDGDGNPVSGATVALFPQDDEDSTEATVLYTTTDSNGEYLFNEHPSGTGTTTYWHVTARYDDGSGNFNTLSKPYVSASLPRIIPDSAVFRFTFEDASDTQIAIDSWGSNDADIYGPSYTSTSYEGNNALSFDGTDDDVRIPWSQQVPFTLTVWVSDVDSSTSKDPRIIADRDAAGGQGGIDMNIGANGDTTPRFTVNAGKDRAIGSTDITDGKWHLVAGSYDGSTVKIWVDGSEEDSTSTFNQPQASYLSLGVGNRGWSNPGWFKGIMDDARFYSKALSSTEMSNLYDSGNINR